MLLNDEDYGKKARQTVAAFESEILQYPWLFSSFMPSVVAGRLGVKGVVVCQGNGEEEKMEKVREYEKAPRGGLGTFARLGREKTWLRERNSLLKDFGLDGRTRILVCEGGMCVEEGAFPESSTKTNEPAEDKLDSPSTGGEAYDSSIARDIATTRNAALADMVSEDQKAIAELSGASLDAKLEGVKIEKSDEEKALEKLVLGVTEKGV